MEQRIHFEIPIVQGGMGVGVSLGGLAGAVASMGGVGTISTAQIGFGEPDFSTNTLKANLRAMGKELRKARECAKGRGMIGFNIMTVTKNYGEYVKEAVRLGADFIASGAGLPMDLPTFTKGSLTKNIPIVSSKKATDVICRRWLKKENVLPDAIIIEGPKAGGHLGFSTEDAENLSNEEYEKEIKCIVAYIRELGEKHKKYIPIITAGGFRTREDVKHQKELGADAVQIATRFVTTEECDAHIRLKEAYINCKKEDIVIIKSPVGMPGRAIKNKFIEETKKCRIAPEKCYQCISICNPAQTPYCITQALIRSVTGDTENGLIFCGANAWMEERITTVGEVIQDLL